MKNKKIIEINGRKFYVDETLWDESVLNGSDEENIEFLLEGGWEEIMQNIMYSFIESSYVVCIRVFFCFFIENLLKLYFNN